MNDLRRHDRADAATKAEGQFKTALRFDPKSERYTDQLAVLLLENATNDDFPAHGKSPADTLFTTADGQPWWLKWCR